MLLSGLFDGPRHEGGVPPRRAVVAGWGTTAAHWYLDGTATVSPFVGVLARLASTSRVAGRGAVYPWVAAAIREANRQAQLAGQANVYPAVAGTGMARSSVSLRGRAIPRGVRPILVDDSDEAIILAIALGTM